MENFDIKSFALGVSSNSGGGYPEPTGTKNITENGIHNIKDYAEANVNVPVPPSPTGTINITQNGTYDVTDKAEAQVNVVTPVPTPNIEALTVNANGTYTATECDGFSPVTVNVPNSYSSTDEGKVVNNGALASQTSTTKTANGTYDTTLNNEVVVNVPNPSTGSLSITSNGTYDVTEKASAVVNVPKDAPDLEDITITQNGTYKSTQHEGYDEVVVNVQGGSSLPDIGCIVTRDNTNKTVTYDIYGYGLNADIPEKKTPPILLSGWDTDLIGNGLTWNVYVNLHSNEIEHIPEGWMHGYTVNGWKVPHVSLPNSIKTIYGQAFQNCAFTSITLPSSLEFIGIDAFYQTGLTSIVIPSSVKTVSRTAFLYCRDLQVVEFKGTPTTIHSTAFNNCSSLADIYVPWSEGTVANAPWGATNATIHYNWTN